LPDIDELLAEDARRSATSDGAASAFAPAFDLTLTRIRRQRRRGVTIGAGTVVAAAVAGSLIASANGSSQRSTERFHLAADYRVIAAVQSHPGVAYVIGPSSGHRPAECHKVPDVIVELTKRGRTEMIHFIRTRGKTVNLPSGLMHITRLPSGDYDLYTCPNPETPSASGSRSR
jgi:hypothetical protein